MPARGGLGFYSTVKRTFSHCGEPRFLTHMELPDLRDITVKGTEVEGDGDDARNLWLVVMARSFGPQREEEDMLPA